MSKKKEISIRSGAAEYLTFVAATGEQAGQKDRKVAELHPKGRGEIDHTQPGQHNACRRQHGQQGQAAGGKE